MSRISENYLRVISEIIEKKGYARPKDLAYRLDVSPASVTEMVQKLAKQDLVNYEKRGLISLTSIGNEKATSLRMRYSVFLKLFELAGVSAQTSYIDACFLEHHLSKETIDKLIEFVNRVERRDNVNVGGLSPSSGSKS